MNIPSDLDRSVWTGRTDPEDGDLGRRWHHVIRPVAPEPGVALVGFACDAGVSRNRGRAGAAAGPLALRRMLANLAWHGADPPRLYDAGDVACVDDALETAQDAYADRIAALLHARHFPIGLGGGHEIAWGAYQGLARALEGDSRLERLGIVNFDAHLDLRIGPQPGRGTSGTPFLQIAGSRAAAGLPFRYLCLGLSRPANTRALLERAAGLGVEIVEDVEAGRSPAEARLERFVAESSAIYLTFCLDVLPPAVAPGVSAPSSLGIALHRAVELLRRVLDHCRHGRPGGKLLLADVAELNPRHDPDGRTARTAARIVHELAALSY
ncbi:MAG: formimidoylglutamase [Lysobacterales bacterium]|jgi:formiminoglutamase|nr:MAG: formimidoylglutamase [Xanthomonadales bacterium]